MKRNTSNWSNFCMLLRRAGLTASAGLSCYLRYTPDQENTFVAMGAIKRCSLVPLSDLEGNTFNFLDPLYRCELPKEGSRRALLGVGL